MTIDGLNNFHGFINDFWQFVKRNWTADPADDIYWANLTTEVSKLCKKYNNHPAVVQTMLGYLNYLDCEGSGKERKR